jgi:hypothetical protein
MNQTWKQAMIATAIALVASCAIEAPGTSATEQSIEESAVADLGCDLGLEAEAYAECLRSAYAARCQSAGAADDIACLGSQIMNDLDLEDIAAELGLLRCDPLPQPVAGACWKAPSFGCALDLDAEHRAECLRNAYAARCEGGALAGGLWCLGRQYMNDLELEDIVAELGLLDSVDIDESGYSDILLIAP